VLNLERTLILKIKGKFKMVLMVKFALMNSKGKLIKREVYGLRGEKFSIFRTEIKDQRALIFPFTI